MKLWDTPQTVEAVHKLFADFCRGRISTLPWSEGPALAAETSEITEPLAQMNEMGYLTINSQPAVDGIKSRDPVHGWGPKNGYVYQKVGDLSNSRDSRSIDSR